MQETVRLRPVSERAEGHPTVTFHDLHLSEDIMPFVRRCAQDTGLLDAAVEIVRIHGWSVAQRFAVTASVFEGDVKLRVDVEDADLHRAVRKCFERLQLRRYLQRLGANAQ